MYLALIGTDNAVRTILVVDPGELCIKFLGYWEYARAHIEGDRYMDSLVIGEKDARRKAPEDNFWALSN